MTEPGMAELEYAVPEYRLSLFQGKFVAVPEYFTRWDARKIGSHANRREEYNGSIHSAKQEILQYYLRWRHLIYAWPGHNGF